MVIWEKLNQVYLKKAKEIGIDFGLIKETFTKGSGKGGQKINKSTSSVILKYLPSGEEVRTQRFRELSANREEALKLLILKIEKRIKGKASSDAMKIFKLRKQKKRRSRKAKEKMIDEKRRRGELKENRRGLM